MPRLQFVPSLHGFHFRNNFTNTLFHLAGVRWATRGLCGGMSLAAFNYYRHGYPVPTHNGASFGTSDHVPREGDRLRNYIYDQQLGSFASAAGFFFPTWPWTSDADELREQYRASLGDFDRIRRAIDRGLFVLLGLRSSRRGQLLGHQVLAYGYDEGPPRVYVYDSNVPDKEVMVVADPGQERVRHRLTDGTATANERDYGSFFVQLELDPLNPDLLTEAARPTYRDLVLAHPLWVSDPVGDGLRQPGEPLSVGAVVRNVGDYAAPVQELLVWARDPAGDNRDDDLGVRLSARSLQPGEEVRLSRSFDRFGEGPGTYRFGVSYLSEQGHWVPIPVVGGAAAERSVELVTTPAATSPYGSGGYRGPGTYFVVARHSGKVFDVNIDWFSGQDDGRPITQVDRNNGDHQKFIVEDVGEGYVGLRARHSGKCADVEGISVAPGAPLQQWNCNRGHHQQFAIEPVGDHYRIRVRHSGLFLDVAGSSMDNGARIVQWPWTGGNNQLFQFVRAD